MNTTQGSTNFAYGDERARNMHAKRFSCARKSNKTPFGSAPMLFKVLQCV